MTKPEKLLLLLTLLFLLAAPLVTGLSDAGISLETESAEAVSEEAVSRSLPGTTAPAAAPLDINTATAEELTALPGVGETIAQRIVDSRESEGPFDCLEDLLRVEGIGEKTLENIYRYMEEN